MLNLLALFATVLSRLYQPMCTEGQLRNKQHFVTRDGRTKVTNFKVQPQPIFFSLSLSLLLLHYL